MEKYQENCWKYFPFYLVVLSILNIARRYWMKIEVVNKMLSTYIVPLEFIFFFCIFYENSPKKAFFIIGGTIYLIAFLIENIWVDSVKSNYFMSFSYSIGNIILLIFILEYFYRLMYSDRILNFKRERMFWVSSGLLVFFLGTFPYFGLYNLLLTKHFKLLVSYTWVEIFLNYAMYLLFAASFIWGKEK